MNIESPINKPAVPVTGLDDDTTGLPPYIADLVNMPVKFVSNGNKELKRATIAEANTLTTINVYKKGALVFEEGTTMKDGQGKWVKVYYEDAGKLKWKTQIACLGEFHNGSVTCLSGPTHFLINGVALSLIDYYKSL